ncbi:MAG: AN1-type zinc finger protein, partial [Candidatus Bathyarchaeia archaeon]
MTECEYCGSNVGLPFICKYCGASLCVNHRLPETHDCPNLFRAMPPKPLFTRPLLRQVPRYKRGTKSFMTREVRDILVAWITLSFCSSIAYLFRPSLFPSYFGVSLATLGLGFIVHELT